MLPLGKLKLDLLEDMLKRYAIAKDSRVKVGPRLGEDAAVIDFGSKYLVSHIDPITLTTDEIGLYAVNVPANDVATRGAKPMWFNCAILLPENKATERLAENIFSQISYACKELDVAWVDGHTEVTYGLNRPIVVAHVMGEVEKSKLVTTSGAKSGDDIILTKGIAIEGTSIIAREKEIELKEKGYSEDFIKKCKNYLHNPGISVVKDCLLANEVARIHCMHDPTEGGLAMGLYEVARASNNGLVIYKDRIPILEESEILCKEYNLDPLGTVTSGSLILTAEPKESEKVLEEYRKAGIKAMIIGEIKGKNYGMKIIVEDRIHDLTYSEKDEITKIYE
ncbi:MAG: AIR synthase family protein [Candidatus Aenigmarchaeota archaeon]|nr:AIR synthase family protein [Candidatus Aenigmarchaeota archaeon]